MALQNTDRIWTTRPGISPTTPTAAADYTVAGDFVNYTIATTAFEAAVDARIASAGFDTDVSAASLSLNGSDLEISVTEDGVPVTGSLALTSLGVALGTNGGLDSRYAANSHTHLSSDITNFSTSVVSSQTSFSATSSDTTITITPSGVSGHSPDLIVNWSAAPNTSIPASAIDGTVAPSAHTHTVSDITDFATGVTSNETDFAPTSTNSTITITNLLTNNGHAPNFEVNTSAFTSKSIDPTTIDFTSMDATDISDLVTSLGSDIDGNLSQNNTNGNITYTSASGVSSTVEILATDSGQIISSGTNGGVFLTSPIDQLP